MTKQVFFYVTNKDLLPVLASVESSIQINYSNNGLMDKEGFKMFDSLLNKNIGVTDKEDNILSPSYMIIKKGRNVVFRTVPQRKGSEKIAIDQQGNLASVIFRPCGINADKKAIIEGNIGTISNDKESLEILNTFSKQIKLNFLKVKGIYIGKDAMKYYHEGWRLTQNFHSPLEFDFRVN